MGAATVRRVVAIAAIVWGLVVAVTSAVSIPDAQAAQRLVDGARPLVTADYLIHQQAMLADGRVAARQLDQVAIPRLAERLHESSDQLRASIAARYPDVATGLQRLPSIISTTAASLDNLQRHHDDFADADSFPASGISRLTADVGGIMIGVVLVALGVVALVRARATPMLAILVIAAALAVLPLATSLPHKAQGVRNMAGALNLTPATATATRDSLVVVQRLHDQLLGQLVPDAAAQLGTATDHLIADIDSGLDTLQAALREYPDVVTAFTPDVELREHAVDDFARVKDIPLVEVTWTVIAASAALALAAAVAVAGPAIRRPRPAPQ